VGREQKPGISGRRGFLAWPGGSENAKEFSICVKGKRDVGKKIERFKGKNLSHPESALSRGTGAHWLFTLLQTMFKSPGLGGKKVEAGGAKLRRWSSVIGDVYHLPVSFLKATFSNADNVGGWRLKWSRAMLHEGVLPWKTINIASAYNNRREQRMKEKGGGEFFIASNRWGCKKHSTSCKTVNGILEIIIIIALYRC